MNTGPGVITLTFKVITYFQSDITTLTEISNTHL